jgi:hypothetical protein
MKVIKRERNRAIALAVGRNAEKHRVARGVEVLHSKLPGVPVETRWCIVLFIKYIWFSII